MIWTVVEKTDKKAEKNAGGKAREDIYSILHSLNVSDLDIVFDSNKRDDCNIVRKYWLHWKIATIWRRKVETINNNDILILQFPIVNHTLFFSSVIKKAKKKNAYIVAIIHDLEILRMTKDAQYSKMTKWRMKKEEIDELYEFDKIIVHNSHMKDYMISELHLPEDKLITLNIFDYMMDNEFAPSIEDTTFDDRSCIIAGNLSRQKSEYLYKLPSRPNFELYGVGFEDSEKDNVHYQGSFFPNELPYHLKGGFGLVWDGDSAETCSGAWGEYLKYNNPHKTSLYLACGIPVIIWREAALADYVLEKNVGFTVDSLSDLDKEIENISNERYFEMKKNAIRISEELRQGGNTIRALEACGICTKPF